MNNNKKKQEEFAFESSFVTFVQKLDAIAKDTISKNDVWKTHLKNNAHWTYTKAQVPKEGLQNVPMGEVFFHHDLCRVLYPREFVIGMASPIYFSRSLNEDASQLFNAVYVHPWGFNAGNHGSGSMLAALVDDSVASLSLYYSKTYCATKSLKIEYLRPLVGNVCFISARIESVDKDGVMRVSVEIKNADNSKVLVKGFGETKASNTGMGLSSHSKL